MTVPAAGLSLIKEFEGCELKAYPDPKTGKAPITIGWGSTRRPDGSTFMLGQYITQQQADEYLLYDVEHHILPSLQKIPYWSEMNDNQRGALLSFAYNLGANFYNSEGFYSITTHLKLKNWSLIPNTLEMYRNPGSNVEAGLLRRRKAEGKLWSTPMEVKQMSQEIDLHNFFKHFDEKNPKHIAAVEQFEKDLLAKAPDLMEDEANWVRIFRTKQEPPATPGVLKVPYYPQTDNYRDADRTCNSSACAMCLEFFKPGTLQGSKGDDAYVKKVFSIGDTTDHDVQTKVLDSYGIKSVFLKTLTFDYLDRELLSGRPVVLGILHRGPESAPRGGHMIVAIGKTPAGDYIVNDPYGSLNDGYTGAVANGKGAVYKRSTLAKRWVPNGNDGWGRIFRA